MTMELQQEVDYFLQQFGFVSGPVPDSVSTKTCPECIRPAAVETLQPWLEKWLGANLIHQKAAGKIPVWLSDRSDSSNGSLWMRNTSEHANSLGLSHNEGDVCSLSEILETGPVARRYFLSSRACSGILRRAEKRGKQLPPMLHTALLARSAQEPD